MNTRCRPQSSWPRSASSPHEVPVGFAPGCCKPAPLLSQSIRLITSQFRLFYRRPTLLVESRPRSWKLNNDVLTEILASPQLNLKDLLEISLVSHCFRVLVTPLIFGKHTWSPWSGSRPSFPTQALWAHIRCVLNRTRTFLQFVNGTTEY
jgi:hypothetical protein